MKISIVMTYFDRQIQLNNTLESFRKYNPKDFNVIIVDDGSPEKITLPKLPFDVKILRITNKSWTNPEPAYNTGLYYALKDNPDVIILQNAECYHWKDILSCAKQVTDETYITFGCYSQGKGEEIGSVINNKGASFDGESAWYNHPFYRPVGYDFCSAITSANIRKLNGYDERFCNGVGYGDNYLLARIQFLGLRVLMTDNPFVIHQWHYSSKPIDNAFSLAENNRMLYNRLILEKDYRAKHLLTEDL